MSAFAPTPVASSKWVSIAVRFHLDQYKGLLRPPGGRTSWLSSTSLDVLAPRTTTEKRTRQRSALVRLCGRQTPFRVQAKNKYSIPSPVVATTTALCYVEATKKCRR
jgi:hypothetical protein